MEEVEESARVLGLGVGLFLIILTWSLALAAALLMARTAAGSGVTIVTIATLVTLLLLVIPRQVDTICHLTTSSNDSNLLLNIASLTIPVFRISTQPLLRRRRRIPRCPRTRCSSGAW